MTNIRDWFNNRAIDPEVALKAGVRYDSGRDALLFPRVGMDHMPRGWKVRGVSRKFYYNDPSNVPNSECEPFIARHGDGCLCICEGEMDALALATWEYLFNDLDDPTIIGIPGANTFRNEWAGMYSKYDKVYLFPDPDESGSHMIEKVCGLIGRALVVELDPEHGDLNEQISNNLMGFISSIADAHPVAVKKKLRRVGYDFVRTHDIPNHVLLDEAVRDTKLKKVGKEYRGKCPLHGDDKDPSFMIDPKKGVFYCHGCKKGGDIIAYIIARDGLTFPEAKSKARSLR